MRSSYQVENLAHTASNLSLKSLRFARRNRIPMRSAYAGAGQVPCANKSCSKTSVVSWQNRRSCRQSTGSPFSTSLANAGPLQEASNFLNAASLSTAGKDHKSSGFCLCARSQDFDGGALVSKSLRNAANERISSCDGMDFLSFIVTLWKLIIIISKHLVVQSLPSSLGFYQ